VHSKCAGGNLGVQWLQIKSGVTRSVRRGNSISLQIERLDR
jgi:hypothetical protein